MLFPKGKLGDIDEHHVHQDREDAELGGTQTAVREAHFALQVTVNVHINAEHQVCDENGHHESHVHERGGSHAHEHDGLVDDVHVVVDEKTVNLALGAPYAGEAAVHGIAEPVDDEPQAGKPEPVQIQVRQGVSGSDDTGSDKSDNREHVRGYPGGHSFGHPDEDLFLGGIQDGCLYPIGLFYSFHS